MCDQLTHLKMQLWHVGESRTYLARHPNLKPNGDWEFMHAVTGGNDGFVVNPADNSRVLSWADEEDAFCHGYWSWDWADGIMSISGVSEANGTVKISTAGPAGPGKTNARWIGLNILKELDAVGEYYISKNGLLYYMPSRPPSNWTEDPVVSVAPTCINITGTRFVSIEGITVAFCKGVGVEAGQTVEQPGGNAQQPGEVSDVVLRQLTVSHIGGTGIDMRGLRSGVTDSTIYDIGCRAVVVHGGNATLLLPGNSYAINNTIQDFAQYKRTYMSGIHWAGVNNTYSHNRLSSAPHNCMLGGGNEGT